MKSMCSTHRRCVQAHPILFLLVVWLRVYICPEWDQAGIAQALPVWPYAGCSVDIKCSIDSTWVDTHLHSTLWTLLTWMFAKNDRPGNHEHENGEETSIHGNPLKDKLSLQWGHDSHADESQCNMDRRPYRSLICSIRYEHFHRKLTEILLYRQSHVCKC